MLLTLLALAAPLPAMALNSDGSEPVTGSVAPAALSVTTSLDSCGIIDTQVVCKLNVSYDPVEGADSYSATVTRADGSVVDYGSVGAGAAALWVPYVGPGGYSVRISAYGTPPSEEDDPTGEDKDPRGNLIASDASDAKPADDAGNAELDTAAGQRADESPVNNATPTDDPGADPDAAPAADCTEVPVPAAPPAAPSPLPEPPPEDLDPNNPDEDADGVLDADERVAYDAALAEQQAAAMAQQGALPQSIDCAATP